MLKQYTDESAPTIKNWAKQYNVKLNQQQFDALVSFAYNCGWDPYYQKTIRSVIARGDATPQEIRHAFDLYNTDGVKVQPGLINRRADEADMFLDGSYERKNRD